LNPVMAMPVMLRAAVPLLVSVMLCAVLLEPMFSDAKVRLVGERVTAGAVAAAPVPVSDAVCGLPLALSATEIDAVRAPDAEGLNVMLMEQLALAATLVPQVFV